MIIVRPAVAGCAAGRVRGFLVRVPLGLALIALTAFYLTGPAAHRALAQSLNHTITISAAGAYRFDGWGTSLAWWANALGANRDPEAGTGWTDTSRNQILDALFAPVDPQHPEMPRLGLNTVRYNIGASPFDPSVQGSCFTFRPAARIFTPAQTAFGDPGKFDPATLNFDADQTQIRILRGARDRITADPTQRPIYEAFANSPPWWMTKNPCAYGNSNTPFYDDALKPGFGGAYAKYLAAVVAHFNEQEAINFDTVEPFNEPGIPTAVGGLLQEGVLWPGDCPVHGNCQEGANFSPAAQTDVLHQLCPALTARGAHSEVSAPDANFVDEAIDEFNSYDADAKRCVAQINTHGYGYHQLIGGIKAGGTNPYNGTRRTDLLNQARPSGAVQRRLWMSEFGNGGLPGDFTAATTLSTQIAKDIQYLRPNVWVYWQAVEHNEAGNWGLIASCGFPNEQGCPDGASTYQFTTRFSALSQYTRFIRPGFQILTATDPATDSGQHTLTVAAQDPQTKRFVIVSTNDDTNPAGRMVSFDLSSLGVDRQNNPVQVYRTKADTPPGQISKDPADLVLNGASFTDTQQPGSINTYVIDTPSPGLPGTGGPPPNQPPVVSCGSEVTGDETQAIPLNCSATDPDGDPLRIHWDWSPPSGITDPDATCSFADPTAAQTTITCSDEGDFKASLTADDGITLPVTANVIVHSTNLGPSIAITSPAPWRVSTVPATVNLTAPITDPGAHDTHTCRIDWDDGTVESFVQERSCNRSHTYTHPGMFTIDVAVTDDDQHTASTDVIAIVVDPNAGFVTGGGWINSPAGAFPADATITGKAHFEANPKYGHAGTLDGKVAFRLGEAGLDVSARSLDWLVVTPDGQMAVKGSAHLSGKQVGFVLYGTPGCTDVSGPGCQPGPARIRMLIWDLSQGPTPEGVTPIYDNIPGGNLELGDFQGQVLGGGNLQIHAP